MKSNMVLSNILDNKYKEWYRLFPFELSNFQKTSIQSLINNYHSLVCVPTGSGKTVPALFAIEYFTRMGKKVIYTSPIKALSNQKFHEFTKKFPHLSVGILTGDIKLNPTADVLVMTAEILQNKLISKHSIEFDLEKEVGCIIHDEIHMINDKDRGHVWEQLIMKCPSSISMLLLSATLNDPKSFASWIESTGDREVVVTSHEERIVPLYHYAYLSYNSVLEKRLQKEEIQMNLVQNSSHKFLPLYHSNGSFHSENYALIRKSLQIMEKKKYHVNNIFCLQNVIEKLYREDMLPAVCFILSKRQIEYYSKTVNVHLFPSDSTIPATMQKKCESILRNKFPNCQEFFKLVEFQEAVKMFERGIAIHHSSMIPVLRELTEILFEEGYIKLLFATETFSVGLNMPIRTTIFTDIFKFDGDRKRLFYPHEFIQSSGRAGRRGIDEKGFVIHLMNMYSQPFSECEFRNVVVGASPPISSQFKFSYHLFFYENDIIQFYQGSLDDREKSKLLSIREKTLTQSKENLNDLKSKSQMTPKDIIEMYKCLSRAKSSKKLKKNRHQQKLLEDDYPNLLQDIKTMETIQERENRFFYEEQSFQQEKNSTIACLSSLKGQLIKYGFLDENGITAKGTMASKIHLIPCLPCIELIDDICLLPAKELVGLFSMLFPTRSGNDESKVVLNPLLDSVVEKLSNLYDDFISFETTINTGENYTITYQFVLHCMGWMELETEQECIDFLSNIRKDVGIYVGEFFKLLLNIKNLIDEFCTVAEYRGDMKFLQELKLGQCQILKFLVTNQSLYV